MTIISSTQIRTAYLPMILLIALMANGCGGMNVKSKYVSRAREENGLVVILPGIEGESGFNHNIRRGLAAAGCYRSMPIYNWGIPIPGFGLIINQSALGKKAVGTEIAKEIEKYQDKHPGRPVHVVGHSGGGGIAVFVAEGMSEGRQIDGIILLAASISNNYPLKDALAHCRDGIVNYHNPDDVGLLGFGTAIAGNVDGGRAPSAGLTGFKTNIPKLYQIHISRGMAGSSGAHEAPTRPKFVSRYISPWALSSQWPPARSLIAR